MMVTTTIVRTMRVAPPNCAVSAYRRSPYFRARRSESSAIARRMSAPVINPYQ